MKNKNLNMLVKASLKSDKLSIYLFSLFTILSTVLVLVTICIMFPFGDNIENKINNHIFNRELTLSYSQNIEKSDIKDELTQIKKFEYVKDIYERPWSVYAYDNSNTLNDSYNLEFLHKGYCPVITSGRNFKEGESNVALVPEKIRDHDETSEKIKTVMGADLIGKTLSLSYGGDKDYKAKIVGVYNTSDCIFTGKEILVPRKDLLKMNKVMVSEGRILNSKNYYQVSLNSYKDVEKASEEISDIHIPEKMDFLSIDVESYNIAMLILFGVFAFLVIMIVSIMYMFLKSRIKAQTSELALYRSFGYSFKHILYLTFAKYFIVETISLLIGILITILINQTIVNPYLYSLVGNTLLEMTADVTFLNIFCIFLALVIVLLTACIFAVKRTDKIDLTILLRH